MSTTGQSSLDYLEVKGIRSFDPDETSVIEFGRPLTLLHGANGSGKTTIIECLKYVLTDGVPPLGTGNFVHDPKLLGRQEVEAEIKLAFSSIYDDQYEVSMKCRGKVQGKKIQQIDTQTERRRYRLGKKSGLSGRKVDKKAEVVAALGVSEAVLNDVTFCHHEDSNWPLTETSSKLKEKFDKIFEFKKYEDAIKEVIKIRKKLNGQKVEQEYILQNLKKDCEHAEELRKQIEHDQSQIASDDNLLSNCEERINRLNKETENLRTALEETSSLENTRQQQNLLKNELLSNIKQIQTKLKQSNTDDEKNLREKIENLRKEIQKLEENKTALLRKSFEKQALKETLERQLSQERVKQKERIERIKNWCRGHNIEPSDSLVDDQAQTGFARAKKFLQQTIQKNDELKEELNRCLIQIDNDYKEAWKENLKLQEKNKFLFNTAHNMEEKRKKMQEEIRGLQGLSEVADANDLKSQLNALKLQLGEEESECSLDQSGKRLRNLLQSRDSLMQEAQDVDEQICELCQESDYRNGQKLNNLQEVKASKAKELENLKKIFWESSAQESFSGEKSAKTKCERDEKENVVSNISAIQKLIEGKEACIEKLTETSQSHARKEIYLLQKKVDDDNLALRLYDKLMQRLQKALSILEDETTTESKHEIKLLLVEICENLRRSYDRVASAQHEMNEELNRKKTEAAQSCIKLGFQEKDIEKLPVLNEIKEEVVETITAKSVDADSLAFGNQLQTEQISSVQDEIRDLECQIEKLQTAMSNEGVSKRLEKLKEKKAQIWKKILQVVQESDSIHEIINEKISSRNRMQNEIIATQNEVISQNHLINLVESKKELAEEIRFIKAKIEEEKEALTHSNENQKILESKLTEKKNLLIAKQRKIQIFQDHLLREVEDLKTLKKEIEMFQEDDMQAQLNPIEQNIQKIKNGIKNAESHKKDLEISVDKFQKDLEFSLREQPDGTSKSILEDSFRKLEKVNDKLEAVEKQLRKRKSSKEIISQHDKLSSEKSTTEKNFFETKGRRDNIEEGIQRLKDQLENDDMKFAAEKYRKGLVKCEVLGLASKDLQCYASAFDSVFIGVHQWRMKQINEIIKKLWQETYRGQDIESIEICCDIKKSSNPESIQRNIEYKVRMTCNGVKIDARGRCSAGQKVLASLVIRLALAEVFCRKCAVLALDEPTANLDKENMESLVGSLLRVVDARSYQRNLQLIIITHDKRLLEIIGKSRYADHFFKIQKNNTNGCSFVEKRGIQAIQDD